MRSVQLLLLGVLVYSTGCSSIIAHSGRDLGCLETKADVRAVFGCPTKTGIEKEQPYEEYFTRCNISEPNLAFRYQNNGIMTVGLGECIQFPREVMRTGYNTIRGRVIRFVYDSDDKVMKISDSGAIQFGSLPEPYYLEAKETPH